MATALLFPGQGAQQVGMGKDLFPLFPDLVRRIDDVLGFSIQDLCLRDPEGRLQRTEYTQVALYVVNALSYYVWQREHDCAPDFVAGHSLGEYNALLAAEVFDILGGLQLVQKRGELMSRAQGGGMAAVLGLSAEEIEETLRSHVPAQPSLRDVELANRNAPTQTVISGPVQAVNVAADLIKAGGASHVIELRVSGAFHSRQMAAAEQEFALVLSRNELRKPEVPVLSNVTGDLHREETLRDDVARQISRPVRWSDCMRRLFEVPDIEFVQLGPGNVLERLVAQNRPH